MKIRFIGTVAVLLVLTGCAGVPVETAADETPAPTATQFSPPTTTPTATPTSTPRPLPAPTRTATPEEAPEIEIVTVRITGKGVVFEGAGGVVVNMMTYYYDAGSVLSVLKDVLGVTPVDYPMEGKPLSPYIGVGKGWDFGGLLLVDQGPEGYAGWRYRLIATAPSVNGVALLAPGDFAVGDPIADTEAVYGYPPNFHEGMGTSTGYFEPPYSWQSTIAYLLAENDSTAITLISAPSGA